MQLYSYLIYKTEQRGASEYVKKKCEQIPLLLDMAGDMCIQRVIGESSIILVGVSTL